MFTGGIALMAAAFAFWVGMMFGQAAHGDDLSRAFRRGMRSERRRADRMAAEVLALRDQLAATRGFDGESTKVGDSRAHAGVVDWDDDRTEVE